MIPHFKTNKSDNPIVLMVHGYSHHFWGSEKVALATAETYKTLGYHPIFWLPNEGVFTERVLRSGFPVKFQNTRILSIRSPGLQAWLPLRVLALLARLRPAIIHATSLSPVPALLGASRLLGIPLVSQLQTVYEPDDMRRGLLAHVDLALPVSDKAASAATSFLEQNQVVRQPFVQSLLPPINIPAAGSLTKARMLRKSWGIGTGELAIGLVGQIIERKGVDLFLRACAHLVQCGYSVRPVLIGETPAGQESYGRQLESMISDLNLEAQLIRTGFVENVPEYMCALDLLAVPSRQEGLGLVAGEAMASGVPVVASRVGGLPELVKHEKTGLLVPPGDVESLAAALQRLAVNPLMRQKLSSTGRNFIRNECSCKAFAKGLRDALNMIRVEDPTLQGQAILSRLTGS